MKRYIISIILVLVVSISIWIYYIIQVNSDRVDIVHISGPDDPIFKDGRHVMVWDKNGKVINQDGLKQLMTGSDSLEDISTPLNGEVVYRYNEADDKGYVKEVFKLKDSNERFAIVFNNDTIRGNNDFIAQVSVNDVAEGNYNIVVNNAEKYMVEKKQLPASTQFQYKAAQPQIGKNTFSGKLFLKGEEHPFEF